MVLFLRKRSDRRVLNEAALLESLRAGLGARVVATDFLGGGDREASPVPVREQLLLLSRADVLLSPHTSALAGAAFLRQRSPEQRGGKADGSSADADAAAVVELLHLHWGAWGALDESFRALTSSFDGDGEQGFKAVRHGSWRATRRAHAAYPNRRDGARFGGWGERNGNRKLCTSEGCVEAHTRVDVLVDVPRVTELVRRAIEGSGEVGWGVESGSSSGSAD